MQFSSQYVPDALSDSFYLYGHLNSVGEEYRSWSSLLCSLLHAPEAYWVSKHIYCMSENSVSHRIKSCTVGLHL